MCGIIGYYGPRNPQDVILQGLKKLEYRGYDSAGIAVIENGHFRRFRAPGKLSNLEEKLKGENLKGHLGVGHTRWATHGGPSEVNAHPHIAGKISIVHNGIIENYSSIKDQLLSEGAKITSDTDSELIAHLIQKEISAGSDLRAAIQNVIPQLEGAYSIVVLHEDEPDRMIAFKNGPPLIVGVSKDECFVASDIQAVIAYTNKVVFLNDHEIVEVKGPKFQIFSAAGVKIEAKVQEVDLSPESIEKQGYAHFMLKEIYEQPRVVAQTLTAHINIEKVSIDLKVFTAASGTDPLSDAETAKAFQKFERIFIVACGTSYYAGMLGEYLIETFARVPVEIEYASEFRYRKPVIPKNSLVLVISQSGETADTLASLRMAKEMGASTMSICNVKTSSIDRESDFRMYMRADTEIGVASTKALTTTMALINAVAIYLGKIHGHLSASDEQKYVRALQALPSEIEKVLAYDSYFDEAAQTLKNYRGFLYMGRGVSFPVAMEGALKLKELAYMHAEGYAAGEMKHGPIALIDDRMAVIVVAPHDDVYEKTVSNLEEVRARGGHIISIGTGKDEKLEKLSKHYLALPKTTWNLNPILAVIPLQLMAYHVADTMGYDVDQPRNLAKSVTVE